MNRAIDNKHKARKKKLTRSDWGTPSKILDLVRKLGRIGLDPCWNKHCLTKPQHYFTKKDNGLTQIWYGYGLVYGNFPYERSGNARIYNWIEHALAQAKRFSKRDSLVMLLPVSTDTKWWKLLLDSGLKLSFCFIHGRLRYLKPLTSVEGRTASFPSVVVYIGSKHDMFRKTFAEIGWITDGNYYSRT